MRAHRNRPLPVVLSRDEVRRLLAALSGQHQLIATLLYGGGLRLLEALRLRVKDVDLGRKQITVRQGKGQRDRRCPLPMRQRERHLQHLAEVRRTYDRDQRRGIGVRLPDALDRKYPNAANDWGWYWLFPASRPTTDRDTGEQFRHHLHETAMQRAVRHAVSRAGIPKRASCHTFRHSFVSD